MRKATKRSMIRASANAGKTRLETFNELRELTEAGIDPMVFKANIGGTRIAKPLSRQLLELKYAINREYRLMQIGGQELETSEESEEEFSPEEISEEEILEDETDEDEDDEDEEETPAVKASGKSRIADDKARFLAEIRRLRNFCQSRALTGETIDNISMRPVQAAAKLIPAGIPVDALLAVTAIHWSDGAKQDAGIPNFDFVKFSQSVMASRGIEAGKYHDLFGYALILAEQRQPIMLVGPAGSGKSHIAGQLAEYLGLSYGETPMSPGATRGDLLGRHTAAGYISAKCAEQYGNGGVFNFEEIDASDAAMLIVLNNALAQNTLYNSVTGETISRHPDFVAVSTGNTWGMGATREYVARERLDAATIDRWRMGRIFVPIDEKVEEAILYS